MNASSSVFLKMEGVEEIVSCHFMGDNVVGLVAV